MTWKRSPLLLTVGVLRIEAHHPGDPTKRLSARVIEAERGTPPLTIPGDLGGGLRVGMPEAQVAISLAA